jgi:hypothetical protein
VDALPSSFVETRESLHALACYVVAPARKAVTGRIGLVATRDGFGTPPFGDGVVVAVRGDRLVRTPGGEAPITTLTDAAAFVGVELQRDPGVGRDLPAFEPERFLPVDERASAVLAAWFRFGDAVLAALRDRHGGRSDVGDTTLWPEHFDIALTVTLAGDRGVNVGCSPGDTFSAVPYAYVGPWEREGLDDPFWNAPFGATLRYDELRAAVDPAARAGEFFDDALRRLT